MKRAGDVKGGRGFRRIVVIPDPHCGHEYGLTPPAWWVRDDSPRSRVAKAGKFQRELWWFYTKALDMVKPIDITIQPGDAIEGKGEKSGGKELITSDRHEQIRMAAEAIKYAEAPVNRLCFGTKYHAGMAEDFESVLPPLIPGKVAIHGHDFLDVNGVKIDVKHKVGGSSIPHGRHTATARARLWNVLWSSEGERQPKCDIIIRAHVHYFSFSGGPHWLGITCPALTYNSEYGIRECEGIVDVGIIVIDVDDRGGYTWRPILADFADLRVQAESL